MTIRFFGQFFSLARSNTVSWDYEITFASELEAGDYISDYLAEHDAGIVHYEVL